MSVGGGRARPHEPRRAGPERLPLDQFLGVVVKETLAKRAVPARQVVHGTPPEVILSDTLHILRNNK